MNLHKSKIVGKLRNALSGTPLYRPIRFLYNAVALYGAKRTVRINNLSAVFWTPTFKIIDDLETLSEKDLLVSFTSAIRRGDVVWDVGANIGLYSLFAARIVNSTGQVIAFEPEPKVRRLLERNIALNDIDNITVLACALDSNAGVKTLFTSATPNPGSHSFVQRTDYLVKPRGIRVNTITGTSLIREQQLPTPDVMKIDVEGAELNVLKGMTSALKRSRLRTLLVEIHPNVLPLFGAHPDDVEKELRGWEFSTIRRIQRGSEFHLECQRN